MPVSPEILALLQEMLDTGRTTEEVCRNCSSLLPEVQRRWKSFCLVDEAVSAFLPDTEPASELESENEELPQVPGYEVEGKLGHGGMGIVYRVWHVSLNRSVALKMLLAGAYAGATERGRFLREAQAVAALKHPNIVQVYDVGEVSGRPYFTMELVEGGSLTDQIKGTPQPAAKAAELMAIVGEAVNAAHKAGIVHRDLKPSNILLTNDGTPKITDFGLARRLEGETDLTLSGSPVGTPSYMAPEQARGDKAAIGVGTDVYALGAILYELLTGRPPFRADTPTATLQQVLGDEPVPPAQLNPRVPRDLDTICLKCLDKQPHRRYQSAGAMADDLRRFLRSEPITARRIGWFGRAARWARRRPAAAVHVVAFPIGLVMALTLVGVWLWRQQQQVAVAKAFDDDLHEVVRLEKVQQWGQSRVAAQRARGRVAVDGTDEQRARADRANSELDLAEQLERLRIGRRGFTSGGAGGGAVDLEYQGIFRAAGLADPTDHPRNVAERVRASHVRGSLVAALDDWASETPDEQRAAWCLEIANLADPDQDDWRQRARDPKVWRDKVAVTELARTTPVKSPPTPLIIGLAERLARHGGDATEYLKRIQVEHPSDFWVNFLMANALVRRSDAREAIAYYRAALAARPDAAVVSNNLAVALKQAGRLDEAISQYEHTIQVAPGYAEAYCNLGVALKAKGKPEEALDNYRRSVEIKPTFAGGHNNIGNALRAKGDLAGAAQCYETAARLDPTFAEPHYHLALLAEQHGRIDDAILHYKDAVRINPALFAARNNLGRRLAEVGRPEEGLAQLREAVRIAPVDPAIRGSLAEVLRMLKRSDEALEHQYLKYYFRKEYVAASKVYAEAFTAQPAITDDWPSGHLSRAAVAATLAGCGRGADQAAMTAAARAHWRKQARDWLRADLTSGQRHLDADASKRVAIEERLTQWRKNPDLAGVRDAAETENLPADERAEWTELWRDVDATLARVASPGARDRVSP